MSAEPMSALTACGLPGIERIPYGAHMCSFYRAREDLAAALAPYFIAGLRANERCLWITAPPLPAAEALEALRGAGFDPGPSLARGALSVRDYDDWYADNTALKGLDVVGIWLEEERRALAAGYRGLRITGNTSFLRRQDWDEFMDYEQAVQHAFAERRIVALCTYSLASCSATDLLDVMRRHGCTLDRPDKAWQILTSERG